MKVTTKITRKTLARSAVTDWTAKKMRHVGQAAVNAIVVRTFQEHKGLDDKPHKKHAELGLPGKSHPQGAYSLGWGLVREGKRKAPGRRTRSGKSRNINKVDLTFTGKMARQFRVRRTTRFTVVVGPTGQAKNYAGFVHRLRPWIGLSKNDRKLVRAAFVDKFVRGR